MTATRPADDQRRLRISVLSQMDPAFPRTHSIAALRLCTGLATQGHQVELVVPSITNPRPPTRTLFETYGLDPSFDVRYLSVGSANGTTYDSSTLRRLLARHVLSAVRRNRPSVVISDGIRLMLPYVAAARMRARRLVTAPWLHEFRGRRLERFVCANSTCVLATNSAILRDLAADGIASPRTFITGNPIPQERLVFARSYSKQDARRRIGLDLDRPVVAYTGKLYLGMRELDYLLSAAARMPDCLFLLTGGRPHVIEHVTGQLRAGGQTNVRLTGMLQEPEEIRFYQQAADVLVTYYSLEDLPFAYHHTPSKLAEYMATGNPIVAADFPAVRDLLNHENAILVRPHDVDALTRALELAVSRREESGALAARAQRDIATRAAESVGAELGEFLAAAARTVKGAAARVSP
jgi:glycosyltransferase involved in cell wall biosynthesis